MRLARTTVLALTLAACSSAPEVARPEALRPEVGFIDLDASTSTLDDAALPSPATRLFYALRPARSDPERAPLVVLHAGGPTASVLFLAVNGTGARPLGARGASAREPAPLAGAHLLYLDARQAGYSYGELDDPSDPEARAAAFTAAAFNPYRDAADLLLALFTVLDRHPSLAGHDVFLMGESYGGLRSTVVFDLLLGSGAGAAGGGRFHDPALAAALEAGFPWVLGTRAPLPDEVTTWFRGQILLEPWFGGARQERITGELLEAEGSPLDALADETGTPYVRCEDQPGCEPYANARAFLDAIDRSPYDSRAPSRWSLDRAAEVTAVATERDALAALLDVTPAALDAVFAVDRGRAYRFADVGRRLTQPPGELESAWGVVPPWDAYFATVNEDARRAFLGPEAQALAVDPNQEGWGERFVEILRHVPTLITRAEQDLAIYGPAIAATLASYPGVAAVTEASSGQALDVAYSDGAVASIPAPRYADCSHAVLRDQPGLVLADVARFMDEVGRSEFRGR